MQTILLLHGAVGAADQLVPLAAELSTSYKVYTMNFSGHGGTPLPIDQAFSIEMFAADVLDFMVINNLEKVSVFGYSMGGYVAMYLALHHPEKIHKIITLATKFYWDSDIAAKEVTMLDASKIKLKLPAFADILKARHAPNDWEAILAKTTEMLTAIGADNVLKMADYAKISPQCMLLVGDRDKMVTVEETIAVYRSTPNAQFAVLPGTAHPIEQVNIDMLSYFIRKML